MKRCSVCKTTYDDNFEYCPKCGRKIYPFEEETKLVINNGVLSSIISSSYTKRPPYWHYLDYYLIDNGFKKEEWQEKATLNIPSSVYKIQLEKHYICNEGIFYDVNFPSSIKEVDLKDGYFFHECRIINNIKMPTGWKKLGHAFYCSALENTLSIPYGTEELSPGFLFKSSVGKIELPSSLKRIECHAIYDTHIKEMIVPSSITYWALGTYGSGYERDYNRVDNLVYKGPRFQLRNVFERTLRELPEVWKNKDIHVNEEQIIHCNDGDVRLKSTGKYSFTAENI